MSEPPGQKQQIRKQCCLPPLSLKISVRGTSFHISLIFWGFYLSQECLLNCLWLVYSTMCGKIFSVYGVHTSENAFNLYIFTHASVLHSKLQAEFFENLFPPRQKEWRTLSKFNQKIWVWLGILLYSYFVWFVIFVNVMALQFCE